MGAPLGNGCLFAPARHGQCPGRESRVARLIEVCGSFARQYGVLGCLLRDSERIVGLLRTSLMRVGLVVGQGFWSDAVHCRLVGLRLEQEQEVFVSGSRRCLGREGLSWVCGGVGARGVRCLSVEEGDVRAERREEERIRKRQEAAGKGEREDSRGHSAEARGQKVNVNPFRQAAW